jgi:general secretion pathway protein H
MIKPNQAADLDMSLSVRQRIALTRNQGFTLIEILIVMLIISIVGGLTLLTVSTNHNNTLKTLVSQLTNTIALAQEQALLKPVTMGLKLSNNRVQFFELDDTEEKPAWKLLTQAPLAPLIMPSQIEARLKDTSQSAFDNQGPSIIFSANGDMTAFTFLLGKSNEAPSYEIIGESDGSLIHRGITHAPT